MIERTLSHYRIVEKIGAGGMGEVYRVHDERLERDVALKVLPAGTLADEQARKRFRKEALALSKLNHPHIATVHDFDTQDGTDFLVMELVEGVTLNDKLAAGALSEKEITRLGGQLAEALEEAHERGVVHRDLKPGNVMVTAKGQVKVLDFGLAKLVRPDVASATAPTESFTETQAAAGTLPYMAPEQVRAELVDARTDIHALGAVLYEMATGQRAFPETQTGRLIDAILNRAPQPPSGLNRRVSGELERITLKCLEKEPENRYQSAKEIAVDLRRLGMPSSATAVLAARRPARRQGMVLAVGIALVALGAVLVGLNVGGLRERLLGEAGRGQITSIAVLPLENLSGDPEQDYFADGMTQQLITELGRLRGLERVISWQSVKQLKNTEDSLLEIAQRLNVQSVLVGTAFSAGETVRVNLELYDASERHLWGESYERQSSDILVLQSEVTRTVAGEIQVVITPTDENHLVAARPVSPEAYRLYLLGRFYWNKRNSEAIRKAADYFEQAIAMDPDYALAYAGLADAHFMSVSKEQLAKGRATAMKALEIDPLLGEAHASLGFHASSDEWDWTDAEQHFRRAIELSPNYTFAHAWYGWHLLWLGRFDEALNKTQRALELDPLSIVINQLMGQMYYGRRDYEEAIKWLKKTIEMDPTQNWPHLVLCLAYLEVGRNQEAIEELREADALDNNPLALAAETRAHAAMGKVGEAHKLIERIKENGKRNEEFGVTFPSYSIAQGYVALGQLDRAFEWLERAYRERNLTMKRIGIDPAMDPLRDDPRFQTLLRRMNFPEN